MASSTANGACACCALGINTTATSATNTTYTIHILLQRALACRAYLLAMHAGLAHTYLLLPTRLPATPASTTDSRTSLPSYTIYLLAHHETYALHNSAGPFTSPMHSGDIFRLPTSPYLQRLPWIGFL